MEQPDLVISSALDPVIRHKNVQNNHLKNFCSCKDDLQIF